MLQEHLHLLNLGVPFSGPGSVCLRDTLLQRRTQQGMVEDSYHRQSTLPGCPIAKVAVPCTLSDGGGWFPGGLFKNKHYLIQQQINQKLEGQLMYFTRK